MAKTLKPLERFWLLIKPDKKEIRNIYVYAFFYGLVNLSIPVGVQAIINLIQGGQITTSWAILVFFVILGIIIMGILQINQLKISENLQQKIFTRAAFEFAYRIPRIKLEALYKHYAPELMNRFFDIVSIQKGLSKILIDFSTASIQTVFGLLLLSLYHPFFIIFSLILIALVYTIFKLTSKRGLETSLKESKKKYNVAHWLEELARTSVSYKLAGVTDLPMHRTDKEVDGYITQRESHFKVLVNQYTLMIAFKVLVASGLLIIGSILVMEQQMNIGQFVAAEIIILLIIGSVEKLILSLETIYDVLASLEKIGQISDLELEESTGVNIKTALDGENGLSVEMNHIDFSYPDQKQLLFKDLSLKLEPNERISLMGSSDSGKTTLLYLLAGLYKVNSGSIIYNGLTFGNLNPNCLRSYIGDCLMDELLFEGTIFENITMGRERATFQNVKWAVENIGLSDFINTLPNGYDTVIKTQGKGFSKGIVDKIILARSIADRPKLLLVKDEFTSLVGEEREKVMRFLTDKKNNWTLIIATREESLGKLTDRTLVVKEGKLIELKK